MRLVKNGSTRHCNLWTNNLPVLLQRRRNLFSLFLSTTGNDISKSFFPVSRCIYGLRRGGSETHIERHSRATLLVCHHSRVHREIGNDAVFRTHLRSFTLIWFSHSRIGEVSQGAWGLAPQTLDHGQYFFSKLNQHMDTICRDTYPRNHLEIYRVHYPSGVYKTESIEMCLLR